MHICFCHLHSVRSTIRLDTRLSLELQMSQGIPQLQDRLHVAFKHRGLVSEWTDCNWSEVMDVQIMPSWGKHGDVICSLLLYISRLHRIVLYLQS